MLTFIVGFLVAAFIGAAGYVAFLKEDAPAPRVEEQGTTLDTKANVRVIPPDAVMEDGTLPE